MKKSFRVLLIFASCCVAAVAVGLAILFAVDHWPGPLSGTYASDQTAITGKPKRTITIIDKYSLRDFRPGLLFNDEETHTYWVKGDKLIIYLGEWGSEVNTESLAVTADSLVTDDGMALHRKRK